MKTSTLNQPPELKKFLTRLQKDPFNKYCVDCKKKKTTHVIIWLGSFVCKDCSDFIKTNMAGGSQFRLYVKEIFKEQWDDYQLRSI